MSKTFRGLEELSDLAIVTEDGTQTVTNKTIVAASNTITTAASGNLAATELNAALAELQSDIDTRATSTVLSDHLNDTTDAHAASAITNTPAGSVTATTVQAAINELDGDITAHVGDTTDAHDASAISVLDTGAYFTGTDVESVLQEVGADLAATGLQYFTENRNTTAPNATVPVHQFLATGTETNIDAALTPKGSGAILAQVPDGTATSGDKRGTYAVDWQRVRTFSTYVASGTASTISGGQGNLASGTDSVIAGGNNNRATSISGVVGGGLNNVVSGSYSVISGGSGNDASGGDASISGGNANTASAVGCTVSGGDSNTASLNYSTVSGGLSNTASGSSSSVSGGSLNTASGGASSIGGGTSNVASGTYSTIPGGYKGDTRGLVGRYSYATGSFSVSGDAQIGRHILIRTTTDATAGILTANQTTASDITVSTLPDDHAYKVNAYVIAREDATGDVKEWELSGLVTRGTGPATVAFVGTPSSTSSFASAGAAAWTAELVVNTTRGSAEVEVTGEAAHTIHWVCKLDTVEAG